VITSAGQQNSLTPGIVFRSADSYVVSQEKVREFSLAVLALDPAHHDIGAANMAGYADLVAPPTFVVAVTATLIRQMMDDPRFGVDTGTRTPIHTNEKITLAAPILAGDVLTATMTVTGVTKRGVVVVLDIETRLCTTDGDPRTTVTSTILVTPNQMITHPTPEPAEAR